MRKNNSQKMYTFEDYKRLDKGIRAIATQYWVEVILRRLNVQNPNQLPSAHAPTSERMTPDWLSSQSRFWYRKKQGNPVGQERIVNQIESFLPGTKRWLLHPFWQYLNCKDASTFLKNSDKMLLSLNLEFSKYLFRSDPILGRVRRAGTDRFVKRVGATNNLDSLTCLLILTSERITSNNASLICELNALKMFLRMATVWEMKSVAYDVYQILARRLDALPRDKKRLYPLNERLSIPFGFVSVPEETFDDWLNYYSELMKRAIAERKIDNTDDEKLLYLYRVNHSSI